MPAQTLPTPDQAHQAYRQLVEMNALAIPVLQVCKLDGSLETIPLHTTGHPSEGLLKVKDGQLDGKLPPLSWALLSAESTLTMFATDDSPPTKSDAAVFTLVSREDGHVFTAIKPFNRIGGTVVWQKTDVHTEPLDGLVTDLMMSLVR